MVKSNQALCPSCMVELTEENISYYYSIGICKNCGTLLKKNLRDLEAIELLRVASFLSYWGHLKLTKMNK